VLDGKKDVRLGYGAKLSDRIRTDGGHARRDESFESPQALDRHGREQGFLGLKVAIGGARAHAELATERAQRKLRDALPLERAQGRLDERLAQVAVMVIAGLFTLRVGQGRL
jgi:hypothetical protein